LVQYQPRDQLTPRLDIGVEFGPCEACRAEHNQKKDESVHQMITDRARAGTCLSGRNHQARNAVLAGLTEEVETGSSRPDGLGRLLAEVP
jgi:hypothetical protein